ncbi:hypothetical protein B296_00051190 [Ensete ventricosum]|uniref:Wings apart-like protein C-terminal domain-containing protein n=1 Tax=Ensete ventricosum TaxID=4639 RepID=A0A426YCN4_ENSVE|nr:hypothetical protein B296_00051190 [Ensete ventricosum]
MIVRTYARRGARCGAGRTTSDPILLDSPDADGEPDSAAGELLDLPFSQEISHGRHAHAHAAFSSQDSSSPWSLDPFDLPDDPPTLGPSLFSPSLVPPNEPHGSDGTRTGRRGAERDLASAVTTATLMEAQEFGEMMEHVDEVNFALDGLRPGHPVRVQRASLLSLLSACETAQQRRLLRVQGCVNEMPFYIYPVVQDDNLLDSPSCIGFLLKLLKPTVPYVNGDKAASFGTKLLGKRKPQVVGSSYKGLDSTAKAITSKVSEILLSCKEIKADHGNDEATERPELSPKWIALLTIEKACLSTVSFEGTVSFNGKFSISNKEKLISEYQSLQVNPELKDNSDEPPDSYYAGCSGVDRESEVNIIKICHKRQKSSYTQSEVSHSGSEMAIDFSTSVSYDVINRSIRGVNGNTLKAKVNSSGLKMNSFRISNQWISIKSNGATMSSDSVSRRPHLPKDDKGNCEMDINDPFAFDEGDLKPSKWELLAKNKTKTQDHEGVLPNKELLDGCELPIITTDDVLSQLTNEENHKNCAKSHPSGIDEDSSLAEDCLLTSVKVIECSLFACCRPVRVFKTESYRSLRAVHSGSLIDRCVDCLLSGDIVDLSPYRTIRGCFRPLTTRNRSVIADFDHHRSLSGGISLAAVREEATREKEEERERGRTSTRSDLVPPSLDDPDPVGNSEATARLFLRRVLRQRPETSAADEEKPHRHCLHFSSSPQTRRRPRSFFSSSTRRRHRRGFSSSAP